MHTCLLAVLTLTLATPARAKVKKAHPREAAAPTAQAQVTDTAVELGAVDPARKVAEAYLQALTGAGNDGARDALLGGATLTARIFTLANWKVVGREKHRHEVGELADLHALVETLDRQARTALAQLMGGGPGAGSEEMSAHQVSADDARKLLEPTRTTAALFTRTHPVFAYLARVDKEVYFHPLNPFRKLLAAAGAKGTYTCELDLFWIETDEGLGAQKTRRRWPLRVVRFATGTTDTGLKILPASDWNAE